jgi:uncharacterized protein
MSDKKHLSRLKFLLHKNFNLETTLIEPKELALKGCHLKGTVALAQMTRLHYNLCEVQGEAQIDWLFSIDEKQRSTIQGNLYAQLSIQCQRCLQPMPWLIDKKIALIILTNEQDEQNDEEIPAGYETIILTNTPVSLITLVEDELILALPIIAKHNECPFNEYQLSDHLNESFKNNPFHVLSALKK